MTHPDNPAQLPIKLRSGGKTDVRTQFSALCYRIVADAVQVCLITSRGTGRWILPKGWPMHKQTPADAAATEAWEEAGVIGVESDACIGVYSYARLRDGEDDLPCLAMLYPVKVKKLKKKYPEYKHRRRKWVSRKKAAKMVHERALGKLILGFSPPKNAPAA